MDKAREFVEKLYNDDDFAKKAIIAGEMHKPQKGATEEDSKRQMVAAADKLGYDITVSEYESANKAYFDQIGAWKAIRKAFHLIKLMKAISKEEK